MQRIIADCPDMKALYDVYTTPLNVIYTTMPFQEYMAKRTIPVHMADADGIIDHTKQAVAKDLFECISKNITYEIDTEHRLTSITGSIVIGRK